MSNNVVKSECVGVLPITLVNIGIVITVPAFLVGSQIIRSLGLKEGILAIIFGCAIISTLASITMYLASKTHMSTYEMSARSFGEHGARVVSTVIGVTLIGWFAVTARIFGDAAIGLSQYFSLTLHPNLLIVGGSILAVLTVIYGFKSLEQFSRIATPFLLLLLISGFFLILRDHSLSSLLNAEAERLADMNSIGTAVSLLIGSLMVAVVISPDYGRFAKTPKDSVVAAWMSYGIGGSVVFIGAGLPGLALGSDNLISSFSAAGLGIWAFVLLIVATWTTNAGNFYSAGLATAKAFNRPENSPRLVLILGVTVVILSLFFSLNYFGTFLQILAITIPPIAGIYLCDGLIFDFNENKFPERAWDIGAFLAWIFASIFGLLNTYFCMNRFLIPALVTLFLAFFLRWATHKILKEIS